MSNVASVFEMVKLVLISINKGKILKTNEGITQNINYSIFKRSINFVSEFEQLYASKYNHLRYLESPHDSWF